MGRLQWIIVFEVGVKVDKRRVMVWLSLDRKVLRIQKLILIAMSTLLFIRAALRMLSTITSKSLMLLDAIRVSPEGRKYESFRGSSFQEWINMH